MKRRVAVLDAGVAGPLFMLSAALLFDLPEIGEAEASEAEAWEAEAP